MGKPELIVGLMSGTSLDGVDAALVDFSLAKPTVLATAYLPYTAELRDALLTLHQPASDELHQAAMLSQQLARIYAAAVESVLAKAGIAASGVRSIGCHGQTIRHQPLLGYTLQLNNPALLAELCGICVVADFRSRDIAAGGQGAPLVPAFHAALFGDSHRHRAILNVGGIANLTNLNPGQATQGFDCGPGNILLDAWTQRHLGQAYDARGQWAASGHELPELLTNLLAHPFFAQEPPKSCGREQFNLDWLSGFLNHRDTPADVQATLLALTAVSTQQAVQRWCGAVNELYVCGGGAHNTALMNRLSTLMPHIKVLTTDALGLPADWVEAAAFAWLAWRTLHNLPGNLPEVTGAQGPRLLGAIYPA